MDASGDLTADDVFNVAFSKPPFGQRGYNEDDVDDFLEHVQRRLANPRATTPTAAEIASKTFGKPPPGKRGYAEDEVDGFLALVAQQLARTDGALPPEPEEPQQHYEAPPLDAPPKKKWWQIF